MRFHHAAVECKSPESADRFYKDILGLVKKKTQTLDVRLSEQIFGIASPCHMILYGNDDVAIEVFCPPKPLQKSPSFGHLCLEVENREALLESCAAAALPVKKIPKGDYLVVFVEDYDRNLFEIKQRPARSAE